MSRHTARPSRLCRIALDRRFGVQRGAVLLLACVLLSSVVATALLRATHQYQASTHSQWRLQAAQRNLLQWAVTYTDHYPSERSAGPGRLPCPSQSSSAYPHSPAPPCASLARRQGWLPLEIRSRGVSFQSKRLLSAQRLDYWVARAFVNNPARVTLNPLWLDEHQAELAHELRLRGEPVAAVIADFSQSHCRWSDLVKLGELQAQGRCFYHARVILAGSVIEHTTRRVRSQLQAWLTSDQSPMTWFYRNRWHRVLCLESPDALAEQSVSCGEHYHWADGGVS